MTYQPGDYFVARFGGWQATAVRVATRSRVNHAGIIVTPDGQTAEADTSGARYSRIPADCIVVTPPLTHVERQAVVRNAMTCATSHVRYNWLGLAALAAQQYGLGWLPGVARVLADNSDLFCSQLVDLCYSQAGVQLFDDGRRSGDCSPGDLLDVAIQRNFGVHHQGGVNVRLIH